MRSKSFVIIFISYVYTTDIPTMRSHRDNICFVFTLKNVSKNDWKLKSGGRMGGRGCNKNVLGGKKSRNCQTSELPILMNTKS